MAVCTRCDGCRWKLRPGECVVLAGRNGSGKTTLLRVAARLVKPSAGDGELFGRVWRFEPMKKLRIA